MPKVSKPKPMPKWRPAPEELVRVFEKALKSMPEAQVRKTFGYPSATFNGNMFTGLHQDRLILRLSPEDRAVLERVGAKTFEPMPGHPMREYVVVPESILESEDRLNTWLEKALEYCKSLPPKSAKKTAKKASKAK
jgi:TfoX/Sxy family transcriptional regulator of competence genes